jgi:hypothetical protein
VAALEQTRVHRMARSAGGAWAGILVLALSACVYLGFPNPRLDLTRFNCDDSEAYIGLAGSIATGRGYTRCLNPEQYLPHKTWPPGLPLVLAPIIRTFGLSLLAMKLTVAAIALVGLTFFFLLVRDLSDDRLAACATAATAGSAWFFWFGHQVMSEVPMFTVSVVALWLIERAAREPMRWRGWLLAAGVVGFGTMVKGLSLMLIPAPLILLFGVNSTVRRWLLLRVAVFAAIAIAPAVAWGYRNSRIQAQSVDAINQFRMLLQVHANDPNSPLITPRDLLRNLYENVSWGFIYTIPEQTLPLVRLVSLRERSFGSWVAAPLAVGVVVLCVITAWRSCRPVHLYLGAVVGLLACFTTGGSARYLIPVSPFLTLLMVLAIRRTRWWERSGRLGSTLVAVWLVAVGVDWAMAVHQQEARPYANEHWAEFVDMAGKARTCIPASATVCVHNANGFTAVSGRKTWMIQPNVPFDLEAALRAGRIGYVVASRYTPARDEERSRWVRSHPSSFECVASNAGYDIFRFVARR